MSGNGNKGETEKEVRQRCPFNNEWCGEWCPRHVMIYQTYMGQRLAKGMCVDVASNIMLSEINQKTIPAQPAMPKIQIPGLRG